MMQVSPEELLAIIGEQAVELRILRRQVANLQAAYTDLKRQEAVAERDPPDAVATVLD